MWGQDARVREQSAATGPTETSVQMWQVWELAPIPLDDLVWQGAAHTPHLGFGKLPTNFPSLSPSLSHRLACAYQVSAL